MDKYTSKTTSVTPTFNTEADEKSETYTLGSTSVSDIPTLLSSESSLILKQSNFLQKNSNASTKSEIQPSTMSKETLPTTLVTPYEINVNSTPIITGNVTQIESSMKDVLQTLKEEHSFDISTLSSTATEKLPETSLIKTSSTASTNIVRSTSVGE